MTDSNMKKGFYNVIRWPNSDGRWWLVAESEGGYIPLLDLHPGRDTNKPTYQNQLWKAAELLAKEGPEALNNPPRHDRHGVWLRYLLHLCSRLCL